MDSNSNPSDRQQIADLLTRYMMLIDAGDFAGIGALFRHAILRGPGNDQGTRGHEQVRQLYQSTTRLYPDTGTPHTQHLLSNVLIEVDPSGLSATAQSCFTVFQALPDFPLQAIIAGRYRDRFEKVEGQWRFMERVMMPELLGDLSRHLLFDSARLQP